MHPVVRVLGPCQVGVHAPNSDETALPTAASTDGSRDAPAPGATARPLSLIQRTVLARLALGRPEGASIDELAAAVWRDERPPTATAALQNQISRIRRRLGPDSIGTVAGRYELSLTTDFELVVAMLADASRAADDGDSPAARDMAHRALQAWRGTPFDELGDLPAAVHERRRLEEIRRGLENIRLAAAIAEGADPWAVPEAERLVAQTPTDEHRWAMLIEALDTSGRRGDALGAFDRARRTLAERLGLSPGSRLLAAEAKVLQTPLVPDRDAPPHMVGRSQVIDSALSAAMEQGAVVVSGEPGLGKTRVLDELCRRLRSEGRSVARCAVSWHPASAIAMLADLAAELGLVLDSAMPPGAAFCAAVGGRACAEKPVALCVDDLDRAGPTSVAALVDAAGLDHVVVVATATEPELLPAVLASAAMVLPPLDHSQVADMVASQTEVELPDRTLVGWLVEMSGGNPMIVEYLLEHPVGLTHSTSDGADHPVPSPELRELIRARTQRLGSTARTALEIAAVCGPESRIDLLRELAPRPGIEGAIAASLLDERVDDSGRSWVLFRHGAVQRTIYDDLSPGRRTEVHHHAAQVLETLGAPPASIAAHAIAATVLDPSSAARHGIAAAEDAGSLGAHDDAARWYAGAGEAARAAGEQWLATLATVRRANELRLCGSAEQEAALFDAADAAFVLGDPFLVGEAAFAVLQLGATTESGSLHAQAIDLADRALELVTEPDQRARIAAAASLTHSMTGASDRCRQLFLEAETLATSDEARRQVLPFAYLGLGHPRDLSLRERLTDELIERGHAADDPVATFEGNQLAFSVGLIRQDGARVRSALAEQARLVAQVGDIGRRWQLQYQRAALAHLEADLDLAERHAEQAMALFGDVSPSRAFAVYGAQLLPIRIAQGRLDELRDTLESLVADQPGVPAWHAALALGLAPSDPTRAHQQAVLALDDVAEDFTWLAAQVIGGRAAAAIGEVDLCDTYRARLAPWSGLGCWQGTCSYGPVDGVLARLAAASGRTDDALVLAAAALDQVGQLGAPVFAEDVRELLAALG